MMIKRLGIAAGLCLLAGTTAALAQSDQQAGAQQAEASAPAAATPQTEGTPAPAAEERQICRTQRVTGSLTRRQRICMTEAEWDQLQRNTGENVSRAQRGASGGRECRQDGFGGC